MKRRLKYIAEEDIDAEVAGWNQELAAVLPRGKGYISANKKEMKVVWGGLSLDECKENKIAMSGCILFE